MRAHVTAVCVAVLGAAHGAFAQEDDPRPAKGIQDNSFLIEEAYNQEAGVVQHISNLRRQDRDWFFSFTQEWPVGSQLHQFSYTIPYSWLRTESGRVHGIGDVMLNYRYQAVFETAATPAIAPRVSLILPTGDESKGTGTGAWGGQFNLPVSKIVSDRVTLHANAGMTTFFDVHGHNPTSFNLGASAIYAVTRDFNLMLEAVGEWTEEVNAEREIERERRFTISPGLRKAFNFDEAQLVAGIAAPIGFVKDAPTDYGIFFYLSFEHKFTR
jgi:Putative MetA-pathway of phenol degradation